MGRIYKRVNDFPISQRDGPPRQEKPCEAHGCALSLSLRTPPHSQVSIFTATTPASRGSPAVAHTELKHTWISPN